MNRGVLGGTFDPVHKAHLQLAEEAMTRLDLAEVIFMPAGKTHLKEDQEITAEEHRLQMLRLALDAVPHYRLSTLEIGLPGISYTVDTITSLRRECGRGDELFFIMGWDNLATLPRWRQPSRLIELCRIVAAPRPGCAKPDLGSLEAALPGITERVILLDKPQMDISATAIRERVARGQSVRQLVPEPVAEYIRVHKLYLA